MEENKRKYVCNEEGSCPVCGSGKLNWGDSECTGDYIYYEYECEECHAQGREWYRLVFDGHDVLVEGETEQGYSSYDYETVNDYVLPEN